MIAAARPARLTVALLAAAAVVSPAVAEVHIGVAAPLTGRYAEQGRAIVASVETAVKAANAANGVLGQPLKLMAIDDGCAAASATDAARALVAEKVAVVIGHACASAALAAAPVYAKAGVILLALTRHPELTDRRAGPTVFRAAGRDDRQGEAIARYLRALPGPRRIALVHDRTQFGKGLVDGVTKALTAWGVTPILAETIVAGEKDYPALAARLKSASADVVVFGGYASEAVVLLRSLRTAQHTAMLVGGDALGSDAMTDPALLRFLDGVRFASSASASQMPLQERSVGPQSHAGRAAAHAAATAFAAWRTAVSAAGTLDAASVVARLAAGPSPTPAAAAPAMDAKEGHMRFGANGDAEIASFHMHAIIQGRITPLP